MLQITVDGDTSTNDTCIGLASGAAGNDLIKHSTSEAAQKLEAAVTALLQVLPLPLPAHTRVEQSNMLLLCLLMQMLPSLLEECYTSRPAADVCACHLYIL